MKSLSRLISVAGLALFVLAAAPQSATAQQLGNAVNTAKTVATKVAPLASKAAPVAGKAVQAVRGKPTTPAQPQATATAQPQATAPAQPAAPRQASNQVTLDTVPNRQQATRKPTPAREAPATKAAAGRGSSASMKSIPPLRAMTASEAVALLTKTLPEGEVRGSLEGLSPAARVAAAVALRYAVASQPGHSLPVQRVGRLDRTIEDDRGQALAQGVVDFLEHHATYGKGVV